MLGFDVAQSTVSKYMMLGRRPPSAVPRGDATSDSGVASTTDHQDFPWASAPTYLVRDNDGAYGDVFSHREVAMGIRDRPIAPRSLWQNGHMDQLIGTLRPERLDRMLIFGEAHLRQTLISYGS
jgi:hypothetical protein